MSLSGVSASELRVMIADTEAMRDLYADGSHYHRQYDETAAWLRGQLAGLEVAP